MFQNRKNHNLYRNPKIYYSPPSNKPAFEITPRMIKILIILILIGVAVWFLFYSSFLKIKNIEIEGTLNPEVKNNIDEFYGKNILIFRPEKIKDTLIANQSSIKNIELFRGLPDTLKIKVNVRTPVIGWKTQDKNYFIDEEGIIFELKDSEMDILKDKNIPVVEDTKNIVVTPGTEVASENFVKFIKDLSEKLKNDLNIQIKSIKITETTFQAEIETDQGFRIIVSTTNDLDNQLEALKRVLEEKRQDIHEYTDLRIEGRVYYK